MNDHDTLTGNGLRPRTAHLLQSPSASGRELAHSDPHIGIGASNVAELLSGAQVKVDKMMADISERLAAVEAHATFREKIVITADAIVIEREASVSKDRKY